MLQEEIKVSFKLAMPNEADARLVMAWRNDPQTLKMCYHQELKHWENFLKEFQTEYFTYPNCNPVFAVVNHQKVGFLRFEDCSHPQGFERFCGEIGINLDPKMRQKGLGTAILKAAKVVALELAYDDLYAEIREENTGSHIAFTRAGYQLINKAEKIVCETQEKCSIRRYIQELRR